MRDDHGADLFIVVLSRPRFFVVILLVRPPTYLRSGASPGKKGKGRRKKKKKNASNGEFGMNTEEGEGSGTFWVSF